MPSKIPSISPGPELNAKRARPLTRRVRPCRVPRSPHRPESRLCRRALLLFRRISLLSLTRTTSNIFASRIPVATTSGPAIFEIFPVVISVITPFSRASLFVQNVRADRLLYGAADILHTHARIPLNSGNGHYRGQRSCAVAFKLVFEPRRPRPP